jgi:hypothetical protein
VPSQIGYRTSMTFKGVTVCFKNYNLMMNGRQGLVSFHVFAKNLRLGRAS